MKKINKKVKNLSNIDIPSINNNIIYNNFQDNSLDSTYSTSFAKEEKNNMVIGNYAYTEYYIPSTLNYQNEFPSGIIYGIIKNENELNFVVDKIKEKYSVCKFKLLYKGSRDGDKASQFHSRCDYAKNLWLL